MGTRSKVVDIASRRAPKCECVDPSLSEDRDQGIVVCDLCGGRMSALEAFRVAQRHVNEAAWDRLELRSKLERAHKAIAIVSADRDRYRERALALDPNFASKDWSRP